MDSRRKSSLTFGVPSLAVALVAASVLGVAPTAHADTGDTSYAQARFLEGTLVENLDLDAIVAAAGSTAQSSGNAPVGPDNNDLALALLDAIELTVPTIALPLAASVGTVEQYAYAGANADSVAAVGTVTDDGLITTGPNAAPPQPLTLSLGSLVDGLGLPGGLVAEVVDIAVTIDGVSARAAQNAPAAVVRQYSIDDVALTIDSNALSNLLTELDAAVGALQTQLNGLQGQLNSNLGGLASLLSSLGVVTLDPAPAITLPDLAQIVNTTLGTSVTSGAATIDLLAGTITIDLDALLQFNGRPANTPLLDSASIALIRQSVVDVVDALDTKLATTLEAVLTQVNNIGVTLGLRLLGLPVLTVNTTVGNLLDGNPNNDGVTIGGGILAGTISALLGGVTGVVGGLLVGLTGPGQLAGTIAGLSTAVDGLLTPVTDDLLPNLDGLIDGLVQLTVNVQEDVDTPLTTGPETVGKAERALRVTVLPDGALLTLDLANAVVGGNSVSPATELALTPANGPAAGGTTVTLTGTNLDTVHPPTGVTIDGITVSATYQPDLDGPGPAEDSLTFVTPPHAPGNVDVIVTNDGGPATVPGGFTYDPGSVTSLSPNSGPATGGTIVMIVGACFTGTDSVTFDGDPGTDLVILSDTQIRVTTPAHAAGVVDVEVVGTDWCGTLAAPPFTFLTAQLAIAIDPNHGPEAGGTTVQITGTDAPTRENLDEVNVVTIGADTYTPDDGGGFDPGEFQVVPLPDDEYRIDLVTLAHQPGPVSVGVSSPLGVSNAVTYTYDGIDTINPPTGPETGGGTVTIIGACFTGATGVQFGTGPDAVVVPAAEFSVHTDTQIVLTVPPHAPGTVTVTVLGTDCGDLDEPDGYTYTPVAPDDLALTPTRGPVAGGQFATITGTQLDTVGAPTGGVLFGGIALAPITSGDPGLLETGEYEVVEAEPDEFEIQLLTPPHSAGDVLVYVTNDGGTGAPLAYRYVADNLTANPDRGPETGGNPADPDDEITLTGECFTGATGVTFGGVPATSFTVVDDQTITVVPPPATGPGTVDVVVLGTTDCGDITGDDAYTYEPVRADGLAISPNQGPAAGGQAVTIVGNHLDSTLPTGGVEFGGITLAPISAGNPAVLEPGEYTVVEVSPGEFEIQIVTPPHLPGPVSVIVTNDAGPADPLGYTYLGGSIDGVTPPTGPESGGQPGDPNGGITITGACFTGADAVLFGDVAATVFVVISDTEILVIPPAHVPGGVAITVVGTTWCGDIVSSPDAYTYLAEPPSTTGLNPAAGPETGGTRVTITGSGFTTPQVTSVTFDGVAGTGLTVVDDSTLEVTSPPHAPGAVDVVAASPAGTSSPLTFTYVPIAPSVTSLAPTSGPETGGTRVTITGSGFTSPDVTGVTFDGVSGTGLVVVSDTTVRITTPAHAPGPVDVVVVSPVAQSAPGVFTYTEVVDGPPEGEPPLDASRFVPVTPCRLLDTRETGEPKPPADITRSLQVTGGACGVPAEAISATMTLTVTETEGPGHLTMWPDGDQPVISNLNFGPNENRANSTVVRLAENGSTQLYNYAATHLVVDVTGYWVRSSGGTTAGRFIADQPERLLDTRLAGQSPFGPFEVRTLPLPDGVPSDASAIAINITIDQSLGANWFAAFPASLAERPIVSAVNSDGEGQTRAGSLILPVSPAGFKLVSKLGGHVVVDYLGYFTGESAEMSTTGLFVPQAPERVADTRITGSPIPGQDKVDINTLVPGSGVIVNLTMVQPEAPNWLRAWEYGAPMPETSSVNAITETAVANLAIIGQSSDSRLSIFSKVTSHAIVDVAGWFYE
ncbi:MAG TPA: IPT/TIG domain-containing protein [Ilumatobacter sp.]|nr:IPT/TIG domain-containing protein [Ilumatobacter sp.]